MTQDARESRSRELTLIDWIERQRATAPSQRLTPRMEAHHIAGILGLSDPEQADHLRGQVEALQAECERLMDDKGAVADAL